MKKKYFIRGFGIGVLFAAIIFGISYGMHNTDEKVMERARELGMVKQQKPEEDTLDLATAKPEDGAQASQSPDGAQASGKGDDKVADNKTGDDKGTKTDDSKTPDVPEETPEPTPAKDIVIQKTPKPAQGGSTAAPDVPDVNTKIAVEITSGMWSDTVAIQLAEAGLVDDASAFDKYLNQNGYASKIKTGSYQITPGMSYKEIAKMISGQ